MNINEFEAKISQSKKDFMRNKKMYDVLSSITTVMAVLAPILIAQTSFFALRISGAILLLLNHIITNKMEKYFREWLGEKRYYDFLKLEFFEFRAGLDHYLGLNQEEKNVMATKQLNNILDDSKTFKEVMDISPENLKENITDIKDKVNTITKDLKELVKKLNEKNPQNINQLRFEHYIKSRYLDQLLWFYKRINPIKTELKEKDIEKSVYFNFMKNSWITKIFKYISIVLTIFTSEGLLGMIGFSDLSLVSTIIVLIATIASIISSIYSEKDKIQKNSENTLNYLQTIKSLIRVYDTYFPEIQNKIDNQSMLIKIENAFVNKSESVLMQENVKWSEIQHAKGD